MDLLTRQVDPLDNTLIEVQYPAVTHAVLFVGSVLLTLSAVLLSRCCWPCIALGNMAKQAWRTLTHTAPKEMPHYASVQHVMPTSRPALLSVRVPGKVITSDFLLHGPALGTASPPDVPRIFIVNIAGNPGVAGFYATFALKLWASLRGLGKYTSVLTLGHGNHCVGAVSAEAPSLLEATTPAGTGGGGSSRHPSPVDRDPHDTSGSWSSAGSAVTAAAGWVASLLWREATGASGLRASTCSALSLEEQVQHKLGVLQALQALHPSAHFILTGHSIGAWIMLEALRRDADLRASTLRAVGLFPTIHHIGSSPNGMRLYPLFAYGQTLGATFLDALSWAPRAVQRQLAHVAIGQQPSQLVPEGEDAFLSLLDGRVAYNFLGMAKDEMESVRDCGATAAALAGMHDRCTFLFGEADPWNAQGGAELAAVQAAYPAATCIADEAGYPHGFVLDENSAVGVGGLVAQWAAAAISALSVTQTPSPLAAPSQAVPTTPNVAESPSVQAILSAAGSVQGTLSAMAEGAASALDSLAGVSSHPPSPTPSQQGSTEVSSADDVDEADGAGSEGQEQDSTAGEGQEQDSTAGEGQEQGSTAGEGQEQDSTAGEGQEQDSSVSGIVSSLLEGAVGALDDLSGAPDSSAAPASPTAEGGGSREEGEHAESPPPPIDAPAAPTTAAAAAAVPPPPAPVSAESGKGQKGGRKGRRGRRRK